MSDGGVGVDVDALLAGCSAWDGATFDPATHLGAAERLVDLGDHDLLDRLARVGAGVDDVGRVVLLLRVLFEPPAHGWPPPRLGLPSGGPPVEALAAWPLELVHGIPLLVVPGLAVGGLPAPPDDQLKAAASARRRRPSGPTGDLLAPGDGRDGVLRAQLLRMVAPAYDGAAAASTAAALDDDAVWSAHREAAAPLLLRWGPDVGRVVSGR